MGFSVSGAAAIIFATLFVTFGMWFTATSNSFEEVTDAEKDRTDEVLETRNTEIEIVATSYDATANEVTVQVNNTGAEQLALEGTDLIVDGEYRTGWQDGATVDGNPDTRLWLSGEQLTITVTADTEPDRVKVTAENGVSDTSGVPA